MNSTHLVQYCAGTSFPYRIMHCNILDAYVEVGDFLVISQPTNGDVIGRLIDVSDLEDICEDKISSEDKKLFLS